MKLLPLLFALLLPLQVLPAPDRTEMRKKFEDKIEECRVEEQLQTVRIGRLYSDTLLGLEERARADGNLDLLSAVRDEQTRFARDKNPPGTPSPMAKVRGMQEILHREWNAAAKTRAEKIIALARQYDQALDALQKDLVTQGKIDEALAVREERSGITALPAVAEAALFLTPGTQRVSGKKPPPDDAQKLGNRFFKIIDEPLTLADAQSQAEVLGGKLASIDSEEVFDFVQEMMMKGEPRTAYIGLKRGKTPTGWIWENGKPLTYTRWAPNEPNNEAELFVLMHRRRGWSDVGGNAKQPFIVEWSP
jgi:hypothetical protein